MAGEALTPTSYIQHHLHNLTAPVGKGEGMFWHIHVDTFLTAVLMGLVIVVAFWLGTRKATAGVPGKWQAFVEICLEFVDRQAKDTYHGKSKLVTPIAITIFFWILMMNLIKMIPSIITTHRSRSSSETSKRSAARHRRASISSRARSRTASACAYSPRAM